MEYQIVLYFNQLGQGTFIDKVTAFISLIPFLIILWAILAFLAYIIDKENGKWVFLAVLIALALHFIISEGILKHAILNFFPMRIRPWIGHPDIVAIGKAYTDSSFPSSHMASTLAVLTVFVSFYKKVWPWALIFVLLMAFARMHNGMHYPTDVVAGTILGIMYGLLAVWTTRKIKARRSKLTTIN
jgi:undecaprenyl-diphosphatase